MKVKGESKVTQSCPTRSDPMDCSLPGSSIHGIFQQARVLEWVANTGGMHDVNSKLSVYAPYVLLTELQEWPKRVNILLANLTCYQ